MDRRICRGHNYALLGWDLAALHKDGEPWFRGILVGTPDGNLHDADIGNVMILLLRSVGAGIAAAAEGIRRVLGIATEQELGLAYVGEAKDRVDLERRIRELDHPVRSFDSYRGYGWKL